MTRKDRREQYRHTPDDQSAMRSCSLCGRQLSDFSFEAVATVGLGPEIICSKCHEWWGQVVNDRDFRLAVRLAICRTQKLQHENLCRTQRFRVRTETVDSFSSWIKTI